MIANISSSNIYNCIIKYYESVQCSQKQGFPLQCHHRGVEVISSARGIRREVENLICGCPKLTVELWFLVKHCKNV